jgi:hypothetical protein
MQTSRPINGSIDSDATSNPKPGTLLPKHNERMSDELGLHGVNQPTSIQESWFLRFVHGVNSLFYKIREVSEQGMSASISTRTPQREAPAPDEKK